MLQMGVNKISTFLYIKIFIVSIGLFNSYLILECLFMFTYDLSYLATPFYTLGRHITPWAAGTRPKLKIQNMSFSVLFSAVS